MIFYHCRGSLVCDIRMPGLSRRVGGWTVHNWWLDGAGEDEDEYYDGHKYFVADSMSPETAKRIVDALGGYLVEEFKVPPARQLVAGGPFYVHRFHRVDPKHLGNFERAESAMEFAAQRAAELPTASSIRVYGIHNDLVAELHKANSPLKEFDANLLGSRCTASTPERWPRSDGKTTNEI